MWRSALGWEGGRSAPINAVTRQRWEIGVDQRRYASKLGDRRRRYTDRRRCYTDRLLSYMGLGLCWESNTTMVTEGDENEMKRVEGGG